MRALTGNGSGTGMRRGVALVASALLVAAAGAAGAGGGFEEARRAYEEAAARGATPGELRPLAQAAYDALPRRPTTGETMLRRAEAAFHLGRLAYRTGDARAALALLDESDKLFRKAAGEDAPERIAPLLEAGRLLGWSGDRRRMEEALRNLVTAERILATHRPDDYARRMEAAFRQSEILAALGRTAERRDALERFLRLLGEARRSPPSVAVPALVKAVAVFRRAGRAGRAAELACEALSRAGPEVADQAFAIARDLHWLLERDAQAAAAADESCRKRLRDWTPEDGWCLPRETETVFPDYPREAAERGIQGSVTVALVLDARGRPRDVWVEESWPIGHFEREAIKAGRKLRYARPGETIPPPCRGDKATLRYLFAFTLGR